MEINILAFGPIAEVIGKSEYKLTGIESLADLKNTLTNNFPELKSINFAYAINKKIISADLKLNNGDTVALLPPFSGG